MNQFYVIDHKYRLPRSVLLTVLGICCLPVILQFFGADFGNDVHPYPIDQSLTAITVDDMFYILSGGFTHALLEWTAFSSAIFVVILAFCHYAINKDIATPVIGVALFCAGAMDAFHTFAATRLVTAVAENSDLIPFTWALSRVFNAVIMLIGVSLFLGNRKINVERGSTFIISTSLLFVTLGYLLIYFSATSHNLPQTQFPDSIIRRPYDTIPLALFLVAGLIVYPLFAKKHPSIFATALWLSALPEIAVELHMAFGSQRLFDSHFNSAHFLKIIAYIIPLIGLILDYVQTYKNQLSSNAELIRAHNQLNATNLRLSQSNEELEKFAYIASHDLQEPLRKIQAFGDRLHYRVMDSGDEKSIDYISRMQNSSARMRTLIDDLLKLSRIGSEEYQFKQVKLNRVLDRVIDDLHIAVKEKKAKLDIVELPEIMGESNKLYQLFLNLLSNSLKFSNPKVPLIISISSRMVSIDKCEHWEISVKDNGIGFEQEYANRIFEIFQRLHGRSQYPGTGIGLAICKKIMDKHHGSIDVQSRLGEGCCFILLFKRHLEELQ